MERRQKRQHEQSLQELRHNRASGHKAHEPSDQGDESASDLIEDDLNELRDFIVEENGPYKPLRMTKFEVSLPSLPPSKPNAISDDYVKSLLNQLDEEDQGEGVEEMEEGGEEEESRGDYEVPVKEAWESSSRVGQTSDFDRLRLTSNDVQTATSEALDMDWDDLPESLLAPKTTNAGLGSNIFTTALSSAKNLLDENGEVTFFYFDVLERAPTATLFLFGKVLDRDREDDKYVSCCVAVINLIRTVYFLPTTDADLLQAAEEIRQACSTQAITPTSLERVEKCFPFTSGSEGSRTSLRATDTVAWICLRYPFSQPVFKVSDKMTHIARTLGTLTSMFETLVLEQRIKGPAWLTLRPAMVARKSVSWCRVELECAEPASIRALSEQPPAPPLQVLSIRVLTHHDNHNTIVGIVGKHVLEYPDNATNNDQERPPTNQPRTATSFVVLRDPADVGYSAALCSALQAGLTERACKLEIAKHERALLNYFIAVLQRADPDVLMSHTLLTSGSNDVSLLLGRMRAVKADFWSRLGRLNWSQWPTTKFGERQILAGRLPLDTSQVCRELVRDKAYSLDSLAHNVLSPLPPSPALNALTETSGADGIIRTFERALWEADVQWQLMRKLNCLALTRQLTNIAGNLWSRTLQGLRAERNEFLLMHEFHAHGYLLPDPKGNYNNTISTSVSSAGTSGTASNQRRTDGELDLEEENDKEEDIGYTGGLVLEPQRGLYEDLVLLLDFNSLYPSIIQEYGICFLNDSQTNGNGCDGNSKIERDLLLPKILNGLVTRRKQVKALLRKDATALTKNDRSQLEIRQQALKLTANSIYGCLGFPQSRFYAKHLAAAVTQHGRRILQDTQRLAETTLNVPVLYGDTDSLMIGTRTRDLQLARNMGDQLCRLVSARYRQLELEVDAIYSKLLLLRKKKYAALKINAGPNGAARTTVLETKGLDMVRRDWCPLVKDVSEHVLRLILRLDADNNPVATDASNANDDVNHDAGAKDTATLDHTRMAPDVLSYLQEVGARLPAMDLCKFVLTKMLTRAPETYADPQNQPHVLLALRSNSDPAAKRRYGAHDVVSYVILRPDSARSTSSHHQANNNQGLLSGRAKALQDFDPATDSLDLGWYCAQQLLPTVTRLCEFVPLLDARQIALALGLDGKRYHHLAFEEATRNPAAIVASGVRTTCSHCQATVLVPSKMTTTGRDGQSSPLACPQCRHQWTVADVARSIDALFQQDAECQGDEGAGSMEGKFAVYKQVRVWQDLIQANCQLNSPPSPSSPAYAPSSTCASSSPLTPQRSTKEPDLKRPKRDDLDDGSGKSTDPEQRSEAADQDAETWSRFCRLLDRKLDALLAGSGGAVVAPFSAWFAPFFN